MGRTLKSVEPTIWALRKNAKLVEEGQRQASLYEHIFGYDPILVSNANSHENVYENKIRRGSSENPQLNILNPQTNFMVMELAADLPADKK